MEACARIPSEWSSVIRGKTTSVCPPSQKRTNSNANPDLNSPASKRRRGNGQAFSASSRKTTTPSSSSPSSSALTSSSSSSSVGILPPQSMLDACDTILHAIGKSSFIEAEPSSLVESREEPLNLDSILCRVPYREMLKDLFSDPGIAAPTIPVVTRAYEEAYMREPIDSSERHCVMGEECECNMISREDGFTGVEFILPNERQTPARQTCVLCHRKLVQTLFYDMIYSGAQFRGVIQRYGNICGHPEEYAR